MRMRSGVVAVVIAALALAACSSSGDDRASTTSTTGKKVTTTVGRPNGPKADLAPLSGGNGVFIGSATPTALPKRYVQEEFTATGNATSYTPQGELTEDGRWTVEPDQTADYTTRVLVRRPKDPADFSGTVVVEWLNVSGGVDADPDFVTLREELLRQGHAWVGVSAQAIGVEGGPVAVKVDTPGSEAAGKGLKGIDPARYGSLSHPGDAYSFDIYSQVARAVRAGDGLGDLEPAHVIAVGESQSAFALTSYINGVQPLTHVFDGFFVHSRGGPALPFVKPGTAADIAGAIGGKPTILRTDTDVPILDLQTESDVAGILNSASARQPDSDRFRLWEVPGTAHADKHLMGPTADTVDCGVPVNDGPLHIVGKAAFRHLDDWVQHGTQPPKMPRITLDEGAATPTVVRNQDGIAEGGVRTPPVDVPTRVLSGEPGPSPSVICILLGSTRPMSAQRLAQLYPSRAKFQQQYDAAVDEAITAGVVLREDRQALEDDAHADLVAG